MDWTLVIVPRCLSFTIVKTHSLKRALTSRYTLLDNKTSFLPSFSLLFLFFSFFLWQRCNSFPQKCLNYLFKIPNILVLSNPFFSYKINEEKWPERKDDLEFPLLNKEIQSCRDFLSGYIYKPICLSLWEYVDWFFLIAYITVITVCWNTLSECMFLNKMY